MLTESPAIAPGTLYPPRPRRRRALLWVTGVAVLALLGGGIAALTLAPDRTVPAGTTILGVPVGGLGADRLRAAVDGPVAARVARGVRVGAGTATFTLDPAAAGVRLDAAATARAALDSPGPAAAVPPVLGVDAAALAAALGAHRLAVVSASVRLAKPRVVLEDKGDTSFSASTAGVTVTPGRPGWSIDAAPGAAAYVAAVRAGQDQVRVPVVVTRPKAAVSDQLIGSFTTRHGCCQARVANIHRIADLVDGTVIRPGATFSLNDAAGQRTAARGFVAAPAIVDGELEDQLGGGVSQFSTTLFNAAWFAGLPIPVHQPHSKYISRYPPGREATLDWRAIDQKIRNDTAAPVVIRVAYTGTSLTVALYGHTGDRRVVSDSGARVARGDEGGFRIAVTRTVYEGDTVVDTGTTRWTYTGLD